MRRLPALKAPEIIKALLRGGFFVDHVKGSHYVLRHAQRPGVIVVIGRHRRELPPGTVKQIVKSAGLTDEAFLALL
jgi:predicted RNA binding protein YcfA (HicA-like mRNA interferase family)